MKKVSVVFILLLLFFITSCGSLIYTKTPEISDDDISSAIRDYYATLQIPEDASFIGMGIVYFDAKDIFTVSTIEIVDKSVTGTQANVIARITFNIITNSEYYPATTKIMLENYFGTSYLSSNPYIQERKFLFQKYESGIWRLEQDLDKKQ